MVKITAARFWINAEQCTPRMGIARAAASHQVPPALIAAHGAPSPPLQIHHRHLIAGMPAQLFNQVLSPEMPTAPACRSLRWIPCLRCGQIDQGVITALFLAQVRLYSS
jgi:hypothetical protein